MLANALIWSHILFVCVLQTVNLCNPGYMLQNLAKDEYESNFISAVVPPGEIGVKFDDIGALENVKTALHEVAILPMKRPELFSRGNLLRVHCFCSFTSAIWSFYTLSN